MKYGEAISKGRSQIKVFYKEFGSYQGDFVLVTKDDNNFYIYKGSYGSCSGCDSLQAFENYEDDFWTEAKFVEFAKDYEPFVVVNKSDFIRICKEHSLSSIFPANTRLGFSDENYEDIADQVVLKEIADSILTNNKEK